MAGFLFFLFRVHAPPLLYLLTYLPPYCNLHVTCGLRDVHYNTNGCKAGCMLWSWIFDDSYTFWWRLSLDLVCQGTDWYVGYTVNIVLKPSTKITFKMKQLKLHQSNGPSQSTDCKATAGLLKLPAQWRKVSNIWLSFYHCSVHGKAQEPFTS